MGAPLFVARTLALVGLLVACGGPRRDWELASSVDSRESYLTYVNAWPDRPETADARARLHDLDWAEAQQRGTDDAYQQYLRAHPNGTHAEEAGDALVQLAFEAARRTGRSGLEAFVGRYRGGSPRYAALVDEASIALETSIWRATVADGSVAAYRRYLQRFPEGRFASEAANGEVLSAFEKARATDSPAACRTFLELHPDSPYSDTMRRRLDQLRFSTLKVVLMGRAARDHARSFEQLARGALAGMGLREATVEIADEPLRDRHPFERFGVRPDVGLLVIDVGAAGPPLDATAALYAPGRADPVASTRTEDARHDDAQALWMALPIRDFVR